MSNLDSGGFPSYCSIINFVNIPLTSLSLFVDNSPWNISERTVYTELQGTLNLERGMLKNDTLKSLKISKLYLLCRFKKSLKTFLSRKNRVQYLYPSYSNKGVKD